MNIFILDLNPILCAQYHVDKHIVKMPTESAQMLSTVVRLSGIDIGYKIGYKNHPCTKWVAESLSNWIWLKDLAFHLNEEWKYRYNHTYDHKAYSVIKTLPKPNIPDIGITPFALCVDVDSKNITDPVLSYRNYYNTTKTHLYSWKKREVPYWCNNEII